MEQQDILHQLDSSANTTTSTTSTSTSNNKKTHRSSYHSPTSFRSQSQPQQYSQNQTSPFSLLSLSSSSSSSRPHNINTTSTPNTPWNNNNSSTGTTTTTTTTGNEENISPNSKVITKKASLKRSVGLLNLSIGKENELNSNDNDAANGVTKSFNDLNFDTANNDDNDDNDNDNANDTDNDDSLRDDQYSPYINRLKRPLLSASSSSASGTATASTPILNDFNNSTPFTIPHNHHHHHHHSQQQQQPQSARQSLNNKLRSVLTHDIKKMEYELHNQNKENIFTGPTKRGSNDGSHSPNDSPSKPLRQKPRYSSVSNTSTVASHIFKSNNNNNRNNANTSTPLESNKNSTSFITPSSFKSVKPLQTAFMPSGLLSKKTAKIAATKAMPETPCKKPTQHMLIDVNGSFAGVTNGNGINTTTTSSNLANSVINANDDDDDNDNNNNDNNIDDIDDDDLEITPTTIKSNSNHSINSKLNANYSNSGNKKSSSQQQQRAAVNTSDLQSCLLKFTNEFDDIYGGEILSESAKKQQQQQQQQPSNCYSDSMSENNMDMDVDYNTSHNNDEDYDEDFPATPTKLGGMMITSGSSVQHPLSASKNNNNDTTPSRRLNRLKKTNFMSSLMGHASSTGSTKKSLRLETVMTKDSPTKRTPKTPIDSLFANQTSSAESPSNNSISMISANNSTAATDISFAFYPPPSSHSHKSSKQLNNNVDEYLTSKFKNVQLIGTGEFSIVYSMEFQDVKYAVKRTKHALTGPKTRLRKLEEVEILKKLQKNEINDYEGHEYVINFIDHWEFRDNLYIMTEFCENGSLDKFLIENGKIGKLDEWRVWKILIEIMIGVKFLHNNNVLHLDLKPANIFITFDGSLKIGDFGLATTMPIPLFFEREGDREYIAPEVISHQQYDKPADIFSVGLIMVEIAANIILPDNGASWQKLRSGDLTDAGKLSSTDLASYNSSLIHTNITSTNPSSYSSSYSEPIDIFKSAHHQAHNNTANSKLQNIRELPIWAPDFLIDGKGTLDNLVHWMINPNPRSRPSAEMILNTFECQLVEARRKCGSVIYEGELGPMPDLEEEVHDDNDSKLLPRILDICKTRPSSTSSSCSNSSSSVITAQAHQMLAPNQIKMDSNDTIITRRR